VADELDKELLLGTLALGAKLVTPEQLRVALGDQARDLDQGRAPRQLGVILLARGWLDEDQLLALLHTQAERRAQCKGQAPG
jgi:hypothetical protein